ncbi:MAG: hypothetical protein ACPGPS_14330, partial [Rubripirellula sp.]
MNSSYNSGDVFGTQACIARVWKKHSSFGLQGATLYGASKRLEQPCTGDVVPQEVMALHQRQFAVVDTS